MAGEEDPHDEIDLTEWYEEHLREDHDYPSGWWIIPFAVVGTCLWLLILTYVWIVYS